MRVFGCVLLFATGLTLATANVITATHRLPTPVGGTFAIPLGTSNPGVQIAQTFTAETDGKLQTVSIAAVSLDRDPTGLQLAVMTLVNGQPDAVLGSSPLAGLDVDGRFSDITMLNAAADFSAQYIVLQAQQQYALLFVPQRALASFQVLGDQTAGTGRDYAGGEILRSTGGNPFQLVPGGDLAFEVAVIAVPEPTTSILFITLVAGCGLRRRIL